MSSSKLIAFAAVALSVASVACTIGEETHEVVYFESAVAPKAVKCDSPFVAVDTSKLTECGSAERGKGHCYDPAKMGISDGKEYVDPACKSGDVCMADKALAAKGTKLKACTFSVKGKGQRPGSCMSMLSASIHANKGMLAQDVCDDDERCAPCINPTDDTDTGVCEELGAHEEACTFETGGKAPQLCCHGMGTCLNLEAVPEDNRDQMKRDVCRDDKQVCAPSSMVNGKVKKCDVLGASGVCVDVCFASELTAVQRPGRASCGPTEVCVPCLLGKSQGLPGCE